MIHIHFQQHTFEVKRDKFDSLYGKLGAINYSYFNI